MLSRRYQLGARAWQARGVLAKMSVHIRVRLPLFPRAGQLFQRARTWKHAASLDWRYFHQSYRNVLWRDGSVVCGFVCACLVVNSVEWLCEASHEQVCITYHMSRLSLFSFSITVLVRRGIPPTIYYE